eukprot:g30868.t1
MASSRLTRAVSLRQQTSRLLATRGRQRGGIFDGKLKVSQLTEVLVALCEVADASELDKGFTDRAFRAADRDSGGFIDIEEFAIWYSSFCFAEEVTVRPQVRQTRELARQMAPRRVLVQQAAAMAEASAGKDGSPAGWGQRRGGALRRS